MAKQAGYLMVDHRASPGLPEDIARWAGYDPKLVREGKVYEVDTLFCSHCGACGVPNAARTRARASCLECDNHGGHYICDGCDFLRMQPGYIHTPYKKIIDETLNRSTMGSLQKLLIP